MEDDCDNFELSLTANKIMFDKTYKEFMRMEFISNENKINMTKKIQLIDQLIPATYKTFDNFINAMKNCDKNHTQKIKEIENEREIFKKMDEKYTNYLKKLFKEGFEMAKIQVGKLLKDDPNLIFGVSKEKMNEIIELKNIIQQKLNEIGEYLQEADANLEKIEENIEIAVDEMIKGNKYLEQASNYAIERRATKFRNILIGVVGGICVALPGVNLIGGGIVLAGGLAINKFIEKLEKKYIKKIQNL